MALSLTGGGDGLVGGKGGGEGSFRLLRLALLVLSMGLDADGEEMGYLMSSSWSSSSTVKKRGRSAEEGGRRLCSGGEESGWVAGWEAVREAADGDEAKKSVVGGADIVDCECMFSDGWLLPLVPPDTLNYYAILCGEDGCGAQCGPKRATFSHFAVIYAPRGGRLSPRRTPR